MKISIILTRGLKIINFFVISTKKKQVFHNNYFCVGCINGYGSLEHRWSAACVIGRSGDYRVFNKTTLSRSVMFAHPRAHVCVCVCQPCRRAIIETRVLGEWVNDGMGVPKCTQMNNIQLDYRCCKIYSSEIRLYGRRRAWTMRTKSNYARNMCCTVHTCICTRGAQSAHAHRTLARQIGYRRQTRIISNALSL